MDTFLFEMSMKWMFTFKSFRNVYWHGKTHSGIVSQPGCQAGTSYVNLTFAKFVICKKYCIVAVLPMSRYYLDTLFILFEQVSSESKCCRGQSWVENHPPHLLWPQVLNLGLEWNHLFHPMPNVYNFPGGLCFVPVYCNRPLGLVMMTKNSFECNCHLKFLNPLICQLY